MSYIAYFDFLGTKDLIQNDPARYSDTVREIETTLKSFFKATFSKAQNTHMYYFSDCAYIQCDCLPSLVRFLVSLREHLLSFGHYFKASLSSGILGQNIFKEGEEKKSIEPQSYMIGVSFTSKDIVNAYILQNQFKGIGIYLSNDVYQKLKKELLTSQKAKKLGLYGVEIIESFFSIDLNCKNIEKYNDLSYSFASKTQKGAINIFSSLCKDYFKAIKKSPSAGRYYLSVFITILRSCNVDNIECDIQSMEISNEPYIFTELLSLREEKPELYNEAKGLGILYFVILDKIIEYHYEKESSNVITYYLKKIIALNEVMDYYFLDFDNIPNVISSKNKYILEKEYSENVIENWK